MTVPSPPRATVRLQFHAGFTLDHACARVPYFAALGISHVYASPLLAARAGSTHGYDVVDPMRLDPERGDLDALRRLVAALRAHDMGLILDIVPNHMAASADNPWWRDVIEFGRDSPHAEVFDIDWHAPDAELRGRVLLPVLPGERDALRDAGRAGLVFDADDGRVWLVFAESRVPLAARSYADVLGSAPALAALAERFGRAQPGEGFVQALAALHDAARDATTRTAIDGALARHDCAEPGNRARFDALLARQHALPVDWRQAWTRINWRRFFDINELVAIRPDRPRVFEASHAFVLQLYAEGLVDGLRIDHIDGLLDPAAYCRQLRARLHELEPRRPAGTPPGAYLVVEKILAHDEALRDDWPVDGTTGYEFMDQVGALLHDRSGAQPLRALWRGLADDGDRDFAALAEALRVRMLGENFAADFDAAVRALEALAARLTPAVDGDALRRALRRLVARFPVYRTYATADGSDPEDRRILARAAGEADDAALQRLPRWLSGDVPAHALPQAAEAIARVQRLTPPVAAKAVEDTAFYRYGRLLSRNEVGAEPDRFALSVDGFHAACAERLRRAPHSLLATATHDHKRGEDARARLAVLSEVPDTWTTCVHAWRARNAPLREAHGGPDAADEVMLYQTLVGAWPLTLAVDDAPGLAALADRVAAWQRKALREGKRRSSWAAPNEAYETACEAFLRACLSSRDGGGFAEDLLRFIDGIAPAGAVNALAQTLLRTTAPGVPDLYQGTELWDFSLVDPDNRGPVDYAARAEALAAAHDADTLLDRWRDGRIKQQLLARVLSLRRERPALFANGGYRPLAASGRHAECVVAFAREHDGDAAIVVATRLSRPLLAHGESRPFVPPAHWGDTRIALPRDRWRDALTGRELAAGEDALSAVLAAWPVALLVRSG